MNRRPAPSRPFAAALAVFALGLAGPGGTAPLGPAFTYQGELRVGGNPASAGYDMQFRLYDAASGGSVVGAPVAVNAVAVVGGLFSVPLDFGPAQFAGDAQWLEIAIRPAGSGTFETLAPRTAVTAAPYAWGAAVALANAVTTTSIVDGSIAAADVNSAQVQRRVGGSCSGSQGIQSINTDGSVVCGSFAGGGGGTITGVTAGTGLVGGGTSGVVTLGIAPGGVGATQINPAQVQARVTGSCATGQYVRVIAQDGSVTCGTDAGGGGGGTITGVTAGAGLTGGGTSGNVTLALANNSVASVQVVDFSLSALDVDSNSVQVRVTGNCPAGQSIRAIGADGNVTCEIDDSGIGLWSQSGNAGTNPATQFLGTTDLNALVLRTNNTPGLRLEPSAQTFGVPARSITTNVIGGSHANAVTSSARGAAIAGGGAPNGNSDPDFGIGQPNTVSDHYGSVGGGFGNQAGDGDAGATDAPFATVAGGTLNLASGYASSVGGGAGNLAGGGNASIGGGNANDAAGTFSAIGGGDGNSASGIVAWVGGGRENTSSGTQSSVGGGNQNTASGAYATVAGGRNNCAGGAYSFAGGRRAKVIPGSDSGAEGDGCLGLGPSGTNGHEGTFIWADAQNASLQSTAPNQFLVRASGGVWIGDNGPASTPAGRLINTSTGAHLTAGGTWTNASSRALKVGFEAVDVEQVLDRVLDLAVSHWSYRASPMEGRHLGPVAEDFHAAFGLGGDGRAISTVDADGVALAAIQGLARRLAREREERSRREQALHLQLAEQAARIERLSRRLEALLVPAAEAQP
jgi:hypothetical protein